MFFKVKILEVVFFFIIILRNFFDLYWIEKFKNIIKKIWLIVVEIKCIFFILKILKWMYVNFILVIILVFFRYIIFLNYFIEKKNEENIKSYMVFVN